MDTGSAECPFCGEQIRTRARRCRHCGGLVGPLSRASVLDEQMDVDEILGGHADRFTIAYLRGAELRGAYLSGADLFDADLVAADLRGADLGEANLCSADLSGADLSGANLLGADLSDAILCGADLRGANLIGADLKGAQYNGSTTWPDAFDPQAAGAINTAGDRSSS